MVGGGQSSSNSNTFNTVGTTSWQVPSGVTSINVTLYGAQGGTGETDAGGKGGETQGTLSVTPGAWLTVIVGGAGGNYSGLTGGAAGVSGGVGDGNGGSGGSGSPGDGSGGGGGASLILNGSTPQAIGAGGGGGASYPAGARPAVVLTVVIALYVLALKAGHNPPAALAAMVVPLVATYREATGGVVFLAVAVAVAAIMAVVVPVTVATVTEVEADRP